MDRNKQIELMESAESRTSGYLRNWMKTPAFEAALKKRPAKADEAVEEHYRVLGSKRACA